MISICIILHACAWKCRFSIVMQCFNMRSCNVKYIILNIYSTMHCMRLTVKSSLFVDSWRVESYAILPSLLLVYSNEALDHLKTWLVPNLWIHLPHQMIGPLEIPLMHPQLHFGLTNNDRSQASSSPTGDLISVSLPSPLIREDLPNEFLVVQLLMGRLSYKLGLRSLSLEYSSSRAVPLLLIFTLIILSLSAFVELFSLECMYVREGFGEQFAVFSLMATRRLSSDLFRLDHFRFFRCSFHLELSAINSSSSESYSSICEMNESNTPCCYSLKSNIHSRFPD